MSKFDEKALQKRLFAMQDAEYRAFNSKLIPTVDPDTVIGVRTPALRKFAKAYAKEPESVEFLKILPHKYYEENNLHACLIELLPDYDQVIAALDEFLPYVDNWATCDLLRPKIFKNHLPKLLEQIKLWLSDAYCCQTYTVRFAVEMLMTFYLDEHFRPEYLAWVAAIRSEEYYVNMMIAWYFATALAKQYEATLPYIEQQRLAPWTHNKAIQKACESYRVSAEHKAKLRSFKLKTQKLTENNSK
jgi:3-methyladenine DNA glycosylase AlkD